jgi:predicted acetyltransferase
VAGQRDVEAVHGSEYPIALDSAPGRRRVPRRRASTARQPGQASSRRPEIGYRAGRLFEYNQGMDIELRAIEPDQFPAFSRVMAIAFGEDRGEEARADLRRRPDYSRSIAAFDGDRIVGTGGADSMELTLPGLTAVPAGGLTAISVLPTYRRRGLLRAIINRHFEDVAQHGEPVSVLIASESAIYGRFGYGMATMSADMEIEVDEASVRRPPGTDGQLRLLEPEERTPVVRPFYDRYRRTQPGELSRIDFWWEMFGRDPEWRRDGDSERQDVVYESEPGRVDGWVSYRIKDRWDHFIPGNLVKVEHLFATTPQAEAALWSYCLDLDLAGTVQLQTRPVDERLRWYLTNPRLLRTTDLADHLWLRLLDLPAALAARRYGAEGSLVLEVNDTVQPRNQGRWLLEGGPDGASCQRTRRRPDVVLEVADLGAAYLGGTRLATLGRTGRVDEQTPGALVRADAMLVSDPPPWTTTYF